MPPYFKTMDVEGGVEALGELVPSPGATSVGVATGVSAAEGSGPAPGSDS